MAYAAIKGLGDQDLADAVCDALLATGEPEIAELIKADGYEHSRAPYRAVVFFLTGDMERYRSLDPTGAALRDVHEHADGTVRGRVAECARATTCLEWAHALVRGRSAVQFGGLTDPEWSALAAILDATEQRDALWRLVFAAPPVRAAQLLRLLDAAGWTPDDPVERRAFAELQALLRAGRAVVQDGWVPAEPTRLAKIHDGIRNVTVTPDGSRVIVNADGRVRMWAIPSGEEQSAIPRGEAQGWRLAVTPDSRLLVTEHRSYDPWPRPMSAEPPVAASLWELPSGKRLGFLRGPVKGRVNDMLVTPDGKFLAMGDRTGAVHLWHLPSGAWAGSLVGTNDAVTCLTASTDGMLVSGHGGGAILMWRLWNGKLLKRLHSVNIVGGVLLPTRGSVIAAGVGGGLVEVWSFVDLLPSKPRVLGHAVGEVTGTPDGTILAGRGADGIQLSVAALGRTPPRPQPSSSCLHPARTPWAIQGFRGETTCWRTDLAGPRQCPRTVA
ncbi:WD40 repeat domain-containing protein [Streptomyces sp. MCAF7]